ncbi:hypothetical protein [Saccharopolyspora taberi]|uniref:Uncharacterized protein n=1 Tax=Saccharopolyspora taberi TaxID=60895 RepID=A0ABN3V4V3_9PSEU
MSLTKNTLRKLVQAAGEARQDRQNRPRCQARTNNGRPCRRPVKADWGHCGRIDCAEWMYAQDENDVKQLLGI